jgi:hypothetical protein
MFKRVDAHYLLILYILSQISLIYHYCIHLVINTPKTLSIYNKVLIARHFSITHIGYANLLYLLLNHFGCSQNKAGKI